MNKNFTARIETSDPRLRLNFHKAITTYANHTQQNIDNGYNEAFSAGASFSMFNQFMFSGAFTSINMEIKGLSDGEDYCGNPSKVIDVGPIQ